MFHAPNLGGVMSNLFRLTDEKVPRLRPFSPKSHGNAIRQVPEGFSFRRRICRNGPVLALKISEPSCSIPDDHIDPRRSAFFMARSVLRDIRSGVLAC